MGYSFSDIINDPSEGRIVILCIITIPLTIVSTVLRLIATKRSSRKLGWDDLFAVLALIGFLVYAIAPFIGISAAGEMTDDQLATFAAKTAYIVTPFFYVNQLFARGSLFILYYRIFWVDQAFVRWIYALAAVHVSWFITFILMVIFLCTPISKWWDINGTQPGHCIDGNTFLVAEETINSSLDFALIILSVTIVRKLLSKDHMKMKMAFIFVVGGLSGVIGFVKIGETYSAADTNGQENDTNAFWDLLQMATSIFCACAPMLKTVIPVADYLAGAWVRIKSLLSTQGSRSQSNMTPTGFRIRVTTRSGSNRDEHELHGGNNASNKPGPWTQFANDVQNDNYCFEHETLHKDLTETKNDHLEAAIHIV